MKIKTLSILGAVAFAVVGCATNEDRADYERDIHPKSYSSSDRVTATSDFDKTPQRDDTSDLLHTDPDGRIVPERQDEQLKAGPQTQVDQQLAQRIRQTYTDHADISSEMDDVRITVIKGKVTLKGWVASEQDKTRMEEIARQFSGVNYVDNQLRVGDPDDDDGNENDI